MELNKRYTAAWRLFNFRYEMYIPDIYLYGDEYIRKNGLRVSGDSTLDNARKNEPSLCRQTVAGIAQFHYDGCPLILNKPTDAVQIYSDIQEHLRDWERQVIQGIHASDTPPLVEFRMFELVAMELYNTAMFYRPDQEQGTSALRDLIMNLNRSRNLAGTNNYLKSKISAPDGNIKPYVSIVDNIEKELLRGS